jgi:CSLREA domain-containing protein
MLRRYTNYRLCQVGATNRASSLRKLKMIRAFGKQTAFSNQIRLVVASLSLLIPLILFFQSTSHVKASLPLLDENQTQSAAAPSAPIRPVSKSVIEFDMLAAQDAGRDRQQPGSTSAVKAFPPLGMITELETKRADATVEGVARSDRIQPLVSSPGPSQNFLAQEDSPQLGTGTSVIPPDTAGAVGQDKLFVTLNTNYRVQDKATGSILSTVSINTFWSSTGATGIFSSRVQYDPYNNRWIVVATSNSRTPDSSILLAISATSDPQGAYTLFRFVVGCAPGAMSCNASGETADFPMLGFNKNWVAIGWNQLQIGGSSAFISGKMMAIDYPALRGGASNSTVFTVTTANNPASFCMYPATTFSATEDTLYVPAHISSTAATYRLHKITGTSAAPVLMLDPVTRTRPGGSWTQPSGEILPQMCVGTAGNTCPVTLRLIETVDSFIRSHVVFRNGNIWYAQTIGLPTPFGNHTAVQWTSLDPNGNFIDGGRVEDPTADSSFGESYAYASIAVNSNNDVLLGFSNFARYHFARAAYAIHLGTDTAGTMRDPVVFKEGEDYYSKDFGGFRNRWGSSSQTVVDPNNDQDFWTIQEYAAERVVKDSQQTTSTSRWGTWWARVSPTGAIPSPTVSPTPAGCPSSLVVTDSGDGDDAAPGNRVCATTTGGCTLRAAIEEANALTNCGTIDISFNVAGAIPLAIRLPDINHNVNINGPGAKQLTILRSTDSGTANFRIFTISANRTVNISGLTLTNGVISSGIAPLNSGGAVANSGTLTLTSSVLSGNSAISNGGGALFNNGTLVMRDCLITGNTTNQYGGGIYTVGISNGLTVINSTISGTLPLGEVGSTVSRPVSF